MEWRELSTHVDREAVEAVSELLTPHAYGGVVVEEAILPEPGGDGYTVDFSRAVIVKAYLPLDEHAATKEEAIARSLWHLSQMRAISTLEAKTIAEEDWANTWRAHYQVHRVGKRIVIKPSWQEYAPKPADVVIELDPGMAFGTGLHPTTQLCLRALESYVRPGQKVLDVGTGSGILAIAAAKLGAASVLGLDVDSVAVSAAMGNVARNGLGEKIVIRLGSVADEGPAAECYDLVVANITARVIAGMAGGLASALAGDGHLLLSGIIADQVASVHAALRRAGMRVVAKRIAGDWRALVACHSRDGSFAPLRDP